MDKKKVKNFWRSPVISSPTERILWLIIIVLRIALVVAMLWAIALGDLVTLGMSVLTFASSFVPTFVERYYNVSLPIEYHLVIVAFLFMSLFLGEVGDAYERFWWWDIVLHASSGVVLGFIGFLVLYVLQARGKTKMSPSLIAFFCFCASMTIGVLWELFELFMDTVFGLNMLKGHMNTLIDLIVDALGALAISLLAYFYYKNQHGSPIKRSLKRFVKQNPHLFKS
jgi:uncharacterized membrane protein YjdF